MSITGRDQVGQKRIHTNNGKDGVEVIRIISLPQAESNLVTKVVRPECETRSVSLKNEWIESTCRC